MIKLTPSTPNERVSTVVTPPSQSVGSEKTAQSKAPTSSTEQTLMQARQSLSELPDVDLNKVAEVKAALSRGDITLDQEKLADSILSFFQRSE
ncbi:flagellar biosynthesis anti-sigma factor FlgM [Rosenbergiella australiborealis]|uniref:Negative regulator of flagellin synthesis n=1 Tax=Rosenbergiella australiborealis TaxID=1544696 RepID=A0ABS5T770_9GAMM|nr:flagellar biosynthesis anti-sigma factor FlgM [Rosenbergiella australiborealis]MBT0727563.1 flagellar biosynthesis anti-sigma factor FlgM [Rosenbergiella australiborealis]